MLAWFGRHYARRVVNVNVNILLANSLALGLTALAVHFSRRLGITDDQKWLIVWFTFGVDLVLDVAIYFGLHWIANHWPRRLWQAPKELMEDTPKPSFFRDVANVQLQRMALSVLFYGIAVGGQKWLLAQGHDRVFSQMAGYGVAIGTTRVLHTLWMLRNERAEKKARLARRSGPAAEAGGTGGTGVPGESQGTAGEGGTPHGAARPAQPTRTHSGVS
jgi:hypothetical protein